MLHGDRLRRAQERVRQQGIDAYMVLTHDDYIYFFGKDQFQPRAVIPAAGPPIVITFVGEEDEVKRTLAVDDVKVFGTVGQQIKDVVGQGNAVPVEHHRVAVRAVGAPPS